jgi:hypothetical protein
MLNAKSLFLHPFFHLALFEVVSILLIMSSKQSGSAFFIRPGVKAAARLRDITDISVWDKVDSNYEAMLKAKGGSKLVELDQARQELGQKLVKQKTNATMTKDELLDIVIPWKFTKGKARPALWGHLRGNSDSDVQSASKSSFQKSSKAALNENDDGSGAIAALCKLRGVGPATASAVLSVYQPSLFAFMDDEVIEALITDKKRGYTPKIFLEMNGKCCDLATKLNSNASDNSNECWTPARVGCALWTASQMSIKLDTELGEIFKGATANTTTLKNTKEQVAPAVLAKEKKKQQVKNGESVTAKRQSTEKDEATAIPEPAHASGLRRSKRRRPE